MKRHPFLISLLLAGITLALYWPASHYAVVFYDDTFFTDNPEVQSGLNWQSFLWAMSSVVVANWHPVTSLSFVLTHQFFGTNAGAEHLVNIVFHAANAGLLFWVLLGLTNVAPGSPNTQADTTGRCALVAALFAWHPFRVESVAWIAERKDVLCGFFFLLTLLVYARYAATAANAVPARAKAKSSPPKPKNSPDATPHSHAKAKGFYTASLSLFALALFSKPMAVTLPGVLLLLDVWPLKRTQPWKRLVLEKIPFLVLTVVFCVVTFIVQHQAAATPSLQQLGLGLRLENVIVSYWRYLGWSLWPTNLAMFYSFPYDQHFYLALWPGWIIVVAALLLLVVSALCLQQLRQRPYLAVGWFWYLGMMVPVIGLVQVGSQGMADRYTYLPLIGPVFSLVWLVSEKWRSNRFPKVLLTGVSLVILAASLFQTHYQLQFWKNTETLSRHTIEVTGENTRAEYIAGMGLEHDGRIEEAMLHYRNAISSQPRVTEAFYCLGRLLGQQGNWALAEHTYALVLEDNPNDFNANLGMVNVLPHLGRSNEVKQHLETARQNCPNEPEDLNNLAWTLATSEQAELRDGPQAVHFAERACKLTGYRKTVVVGTLGAAYAEAGRYEEAIATAQKACALATEAGEPALVKKNQELLMLYQQHQPYHEATNL